MEFSPNSVSSPQQNKMVQERRPLGKLAEHSSTQTLLYDSFYVVHNIILVL